MEHKDLTPIKKVYVMDSYSEIEWLTPIDEDHRVLVFREKTNNWAAMKRWCEQHSEDTVAIWCGGYKDVHFYFFRKSDAMAFKLRWT